MEISGNHKESNMSEWPGVSVVIPVLNQRERLAELLAIMQSQDFPPEKMEIIVIDNGSEDGTWEYIASLPGIQAERVTSSRSPYVCRNRGIALAKQGWTLLMDAGLTIKGNTWLSEYMADVQDVKCIYTVRYLPMHADMEISQWCEMLSLFYYNLLADQGKATTGGAFIAHRSAFHICGQFDEYRSGGDVRWIQKALKKGYSIQTSANSIVYYTPKKFKAYLRKTARIGNSEYLQSVRQKVPQWKYVLQKIAEMRPPNPVWLYTCLKYHYEHQKPIFWYIQLWGALWYFRVYQKMVALNNIKGESD
jgi:glycosyltransferase involved in cell wall biosynthesis